ncbi:hypothetical protein [Hymenobacter metallicola]|uniref:Uncharacterized protein n=1 Tax=Hymenobacter metallicola TaxID=2563114 RepID=A0A4Z0PZQ3_9BACT|nr:hypothetical protein [Hymenobacter metallicola]TGE22799.1 hypothetical protein E5K02_20760 [Hymenobacter metallicola]
MQTKEQLETFRNLCKANGLGKTDVWQHKQSGNWIIGRAGIEKIQGLNNIQIGIELAAAGVDFAVVKASAARTVERKKIKVESLGSANAKNSQVSYYAEMAEKRAKSRSILMLMGFYELGVYGEEESDEFKQSKNVGAPTLDDVEAAPTARPIQPAAAPVATPPASTTPTQPAAPAQKVVGHTMPQDDNMGEPVPVYGVTAEQRKRLLQQLESPLITETERTKSTARIDSLTEREATDAIVKMEGILAWRAASNELYEFAKMNEPELGQAETGRLLALCKDTSVTAEALLKEKELGLAYLADEATLPLPSLEDARQNLRGFADDNAAKLGSVEYDRLVKRSQAKTANAEELVQELVDAQARLQPIAA